MKVLITGGLGYIGRHVVKACVEAGHEVMTFDRKASRLENEWPGVTYYWGDAMDTFNISYAKWPEAVVHLAADINVAESVVSPRLYYMNNVTRGLEVLEWCRRSNVKHVVFASSAAVYGPSRHTQHEDHNLEPMNPYGNTKLAFERALADYARAYMMNALSLRFFNVAGGEFPERHDPETHLIPNLVDAALYGKPFTLNGVDHRTIDGTCVRDYVNVSDVAAACVKALAFPPAVHHSGLPGCAINIGSGVGSSVYQVIDTVRRVTGKPLDYGVSSRREGDPASLIADITRAREVLEWEPRRSDLESIVCDTVATRTQRL